jgi:hypothetical protein
MKSRRDDKILVLIPDSTQILKGWHDMCGTNDTPSGLINCRAKIYDPGTPSEFLFCHSSLDRVLGYGLKYPDAFQNTHLGRIGK